MRKRKQIPQYYWSFSSGKIGDILYTDTHKHLVIKDYLEFSKLNEHTPLIQARTGPISFQILFDKDLEAGV